MRFSKTKLAVATTLALAFTGVNAATITIDTVLVNILKDGSTGESMIIDTKIAPTDFRNGAITSWTSNIDLTAAIDTFIGTSTNVKYYVAGYEVANSAWDKFAYSNKTQLDEIAVDAMNSQFQNFVSNANSGPFATATVGLTENWKAGVPDGDDAHFENTFLFGNGFVASYDMGVAAPFFISHSALLTTGTDTQLLDWNLNDTGVLSYGVSAVPVPAAVWLFGSGLIGLVGVARRRKA